ncbi:Heat shock 70 kDa protein 12A [Lunasporangiospora selenospora]|uniref:Heat shock 70 kDa protein 12A n=1 Tax=Lunasporangiospora selenospora TaxID=979761 RepID=A0A9P6FKX0_9FUNG|nr:Heat shock 70 kDa protein 12A [Lunasporangiospora selenospora]
MWSDRAKNVMRQAAIRAKMIKESDRRFKLESGDQFMVCDAGGGTVDLIVFEVTRTSAGRTLSEVTKGHGASCGSVFLDRRFRTLLEDRFKKQDVSISAVTISQMVDTFANEIKPHFDEKEDQYLRLTARWNLDATSNHAALGIEEDSMVFTGQELKEHVFDPVVEDVIKLIEIQLLQAPKCSTIFLVGGFGSSDYLSRRIRKQLEPRGLKILVPPRPELAIVRGAVHVGLNPKVVTARISRRFYGVETNEPFEQDKDPESTRVEEVSGSWCQKRFTCFVTKAEKLKIDQCVVREFAALKWSEIPQDFAIPLLSCDDGVSPPRHTTASGVTRLAKVCIPWPFAISDEIGKEIKVVVKMYFGLNEIKAVASIDDKDYGATIKFDAIDSY